MKLDVILKIGVVVFILYGWIANLIEAISIFVNNVPFDQLNTLDIGHIIGVFIAPLGIVLGYF